MLASRALTHLKKGVKSRKIHTSSRVDAKRVLVVAEHNNQALGGATLNAVSAASALNPSEGIDVLVVGAKCGEVAKSAQAISGATRVLVKEGGLYEHHAAEPLAKFLEGWVKKVQYTHVIAASSTFSKNVLPRLAALLDVQPISDVLAIKSDDTFVRPIYAGNALATVQSKDAGAKVLTVRSTAFTAAAATGGSASVENIAEDFGAEAVRTSKFVSLEAAASERPELTSAKVVISGGRGMGNGENFKILYDLADAFGNKAAVGASRAAVDAGFVPNDLQVGQTGKIVAPDFYLAVGISGAIQHLAGMKDSKIIAAINKDEEAPIFQVADFGLVGDLFDHVPKLTAAVKSAK
jgi:electron transfer flavoprotein alpha subunit